MITHTTCVDVDALRAADLYDLMVNPTDARYRRWWPGTHRQFHVLRRHPVTSPVGDVVVMDELVGRRHLRFRGVVRLADPGRRIVWQLGVGVSGPVWLDLTLSEIPEGVRVEHVLRLGFQGRAGRLIDPLIRLYFTEKFAATLAEHARTEFPLLAQGGVAPAVTRPLPMRWLWRRAAAAALGRAHTERLLSLMETEYASVLADRPGDVDDSPALTGHFDRSIAPLIAAYRSLELMGDPDPLSRLRSISDARWATIAHVFGVISRLPVPWSLFVMLVDRIMAAGYPPAGWDITWVERSDARVAFDVHGCFYLRTFSRYGVPQLTALACHGDDVLYERLPGARFVRHGTLGRGDAVCDFSFVRGRP